MGGGGARQGRAGVRVLRALSPSCVLTGSATGVTCVKVGHMRKWTQFVRVNAGTSIREGTLVSGCFLLSQVDPGRAAPGRGLGCITEPLGVSPFLNW